LMLHQVGTCPWPLPNVWLGTSIESDEYCWRADELRAAPAVVRFLSLEPLLGPLASLNLDGVDWVIVGGESGPNARPMHPDWARSLRDECLTAGIAYHFKQWGTWAPGHPHGEGEDGPGDRFVNLDGTTGWASYNTDGGCVDSWCGDFGPDSHFVSRVGKKRAGRELDGRTRDEFPKADGGRVSA
jgi:protein gp37